MGLNECPNEYGLGMWCSMNVLMILALAYDLEYMFPGFWEDKETKGVLLGGGAWLPIDSLGC